MNVLDLFSLQGKVALVTGGAGLYGRQIATALSQAGAKTYVTSRNKENLSKIERDFAMQGCDVAAAYMDLEREETMTALKERIVGAEGRFDILVNNAVARVMSDWNDPTERFARSMAINAAGLYALTKAFGNVMQQQGGGSIINIASIQGMVGPDVTLYEGVDFHSLLPDYFFHKGGMLNFTRFVAGYYGSSHVRCNCVSPGGFQSAKTIEPFLTKYNERTMLGRMANHTDLMGAIVFLASDASAYVTGANLPVDGGYTAK